MRPSPERWERMKAPFHGALERPPAERDAFLAQACAGDRELLEDVRSLLRASAEAGRFLEKPAAGPPTIDEGTSGDGSDGIETSPGTIVGAYRLLEVIGRGGMGTVYRAVRVDDVYEKAVALKLVNHGMDTDFVLRRFRDERRILAQLDHPHIARLLDGGTSPDGRPYFVMEHIEGMPLDRYAETHGLDVRRRLELFLPVCAAVQHAHGNLVVHRDLKPANILVTADGRPKLLDFGIAKLLDGEASGRTVTVMRLMTPEYASPEQVQGEPITTATDVYALGVVLYELLSGRRPFDLPNRTPQELARTIGQEDPPPPSARTTADRRRALHGELDNIVLTALRREPSRRYASVEQLARDVRAFLDGRPVQAQRDTFGYRAAKFVRRNRVGVAAGAAVLVSLLAGATAATWQARVARAERARAEQRFADVRRLANTLIGDVDDAIKDLPGATRARQLVATQGLEYVDRLAREAEGDVALQKELAFAYMTIGQIQGGDAGPSLGDWKGALASVGKAIALYTAPAAAAPDDLELQDRLATCHTRAGWLHVRLGDHEAGAASLTRALEIATAAAARAPENVRLLKVVIAADRQIASIRQDQGDITGALESTRRALDRLESAPAAGAKDADLENTRATIYVAMARLLSRAEDYAAAADLYARAQALREARLAEEPQSVRRRRSLAIVHCEAGMNLCELERWSEALAHGREAERLVRLQGDADAADADTKQLLLFVDMLLCKAGARASGRVVPHCANAVARGAALFDAGHDTRSRLDLMRAYAVLGGARHAVGDHAGALEAYGRELSLVEPLLREGAVDPRLRRFAASTHMQIGDTRRTQARRASTLSARRRLWTEARDSYRRALDVLEGYKLRLPDGRQPDHDRARRGLEESSAALATLGGS